MEEASRTDWSDEDVAADVASNPIWYHTMELRPGIVTPGWFDPRPTVDKLPWPDVAGKRVLDVGTYDGFFAFELERRGAREVVATDIAGHEDWDFPPRVRARGVEYLREYAGEKGRGYEIAAKALGSQSRKVVISVYDLSPETIGTYDVVVCGALLLHLRDPFRALAAIRSVCEDHFLSLEEIDLSTTLAYRRRPVTSIHRIEMTQWHIPNLAGHRQMLKAAGFDIERGARPYVVPFGSAHPPRRGHRARRFLTRLTLGGEGVPHSAVLARPAPLGAPA